MQQSFYYPNQIENLLFAVCFILQPIIASPNFIELSFGSNKSFATPLLQWSKDLIQRSFAASTKIRH